MCLLFSLQWIFHCFIFWIRKFMKSQFLLHIWNAIRNRCCSFRICYGLSKHQCNFDILITYNYHGWLYLATYLLLTSKNKKKHSVLAVYDLGPHCNFPIKLRVVKSMICISISAAIGGGSNGLLIMQSVGQARQFAYKNL